MPSLHLASDELTAPVRSSYTPPPFHVASIQRQPVVARLSYGFTGDPKLIAGLARNASAVSVKSHRY